ncbi:MAG: DUF4982 domain-containing protein [Bifidobacterium sp.]|nr:DUF4982 domain-containing protein [Bifidobacterium sp.]
MIRTPFNENWICQPFGSLYNSDGASAQKVTLPHDAMLEGGRAAGNSGGSETGYHKPGAWRYTKQFEVPQDWENKRITLEFEGVYRDAMVFINGAYAGQHEYGYSRFFIPADPYLEYGKTNTVVVECRAHKDSRWYSGAGIYKPVNMLVGSLVHVVPEGIRVTPSTSDGDGLVLIDTDVVNESTATQGIMVNAVVNAQDGGQCTADGVEATVKAGEKLTIHQRLYVDDPLLWDVDSPNLYEVAVQLTQDGDVLDSTSSTFGFRTLQLDPKHGLRINGKVVKLRGTCVHHDNGILGSASFEAAEERRLRILKNAGFNAIRSAHDPVSRATLEAADRLGMLIMDETFDMWNTAKSSNDYSLRFEDHWQDDVDAMVARDYNHPSVILYSIGNEIMEIGTHHGARKGRQIVNRIRSLDSSRYILSAINGAIAAQDALMQMMSQQSDGKSINDELSSAADMMSQIMKLPQVGQAIEESAGMLDIVGLNYGEARYAVDHEAHPNRVFVGSETFPTQIEKLWAMVNDLPYLIGDFTWVGWDYLGETGVGNPKYPDEASPFAAPYPALTTNSGDIGITGVRRAASYYREVVFGFRKDPYIAVEDPAHAAHPAVPTAWSWSDAVAKWNWDVPEGTKVVVEVYADADEISYVLNGEEAARAKVGIDKVFFAKAAVPYRPGTLEAIAYRDGEIVGRSQLQTTAEPVKINLVRFNPKDRVLAEDIELVEISVVDDQGRISWTGDVKVKATVDGGHLQGLGTGRSATEESFLDGCCTTYQGRALAAVRRGGEGQCALTVSAEGLPSATISC